MRGYETTSADTLLIPLFAHPQRHRLLFIICAKADRCFEAADEFHIVPGTIACATMRPPYEQVLDWKLTKATVVAGCGSLKL